ncbi:hypothetical protein BDF22DRAFT_745989 [Syncephalis plumigaleata]|nr:hypothetical protein BDF22DRAFT_745989 [Syncephalis plumigaleata]
MLTDSEDEQLLAELALAASSFEITPIATRVQPSIKRKQPSTTACIDITDTDEQTRQLEGEPHRKVTRITLTPEYATSANTSNNTMSACPICYEQFDSSMLEEHAAQCQGKLDAINDDSTGVCPVCNKSFPSDVLEAHVNEELAQWNDDDDEDAALSDGLNDTEHTSMTSAVNDQSGLHDLDQSIFISDDENDWFNDRPSGIEILSQQQQPSVTATTATATATSNSTRTTTIQPVSSNQVSGRLSPIQGLLNLHEARHQYPELEGYFNQFKIDEDASALSMTMMDTSSTSTFTHYNNNNSNSNRYQRTTSTNTNTRIRPVQSRNSKAARSTTSNRRTTTTSNGNRTSNASSTFNHYAGDPVLPDTDYNYGELQWEGQGYRPW